MFILENIRSGDGDTGKQTEQERFYQVFHKNNTKTKGIKHNSKQELQKIHRSSHKLFKTIF